ncbi:MAG: tRNA-dihydrouridine synthase [Nanoarchaeota archaeon]|nr:tRNA-dihydrouridine synthase [Nanoarchaeota archaeon]
MKIQKIRIGGKSIWPFTNGSGILTTDAYCAANLMSRCEHYGMWTSKATSLREVVMPTRELMRSNPLGLEFGCRETILVQESDGTFLNAVKLINEGAEKTRVKIQGANIPRDRVICIQVFGNSIPEFAEATEALEDLCDIIQLNGSCPHAEKTGMVFGQDPKIVYDLVKKVREVTKKDIDFKLTPNTPNIEEIARAAVEGGATWLSGINTTGPFESPYLYNGRGGRSGRAIKEIGLQKVREIRQAVGNHIRITGMGGIETARDVEEYFSAGADVVGFGSVFAGMSDDDVVNFLPAIAYDLENGTDSASSYRRKVNMSYKRVRIEKILNSCCDFKVFRTNVSIDAKPGQFVYAFLLGDMMLNGKPGEKPFSVMDNDPLTLGVLERGYFTERFNLLREGESFLYRGPYGQGVDVPNGSNVVLAAGGCGIAGLFLLAKKLSSRAKLSSLFGAKDKEHLPYLGEFRRYGDVKIATEDGSLGKRGLVVDLFNESFVREFSRGAYFFNCGPRKMVEAVLPLELEVTGPERIYSSVDYMTRCGVGICGSCVDSKGRRTCVEGPFMRIE